jgi:putative ABC transport system permease protein
VTGWRTALRMARREARRAKGRSALVVAMIMLPVAALAFLAVSYDTFTLTPDEKADRVMGTAQAQLSWPYDGPVQQVPNLLRAFNTGTPPEQNDPTDERLLALLPQGSRVIRDQSGSLNLRTATGTGALRARMLDYTDPLARGIYRQLDGRAPASDDEVVLTRAATDRLGAGIGGTVRLTDGSRSFTVVGTIEDPANLQATTVVLRPQKLPLESLTWLAGMPGSLTWPQVKDLNTRGVVALSRYVLANPPSPAEEYRLGVHFSSGDAIPAGVLTLAGGLAMLEIVLLAGPAFAVGARRRQRDLALMSASGAAPGQVRRIVLADGVVLGSMAAISGVALGVLAAAALHPSVEGFLVRRSGEFRMYPLALAILVGAAVLTGVLAALVPAWITARQDVVTALAGRRGITRSRRRWPIIGLILAAAGVAVMVLSANSLELTPVLVGLIAFELGLVLCTPAIVGLVGRLGRLLPVAPRIALRDASRNRTAAAPAISAVMAAVVGSMTIATVLVASNHREQAGFAGKVGDVAVFSIDEEGPKARFSPEVEAQLRTALPVDQVHQINLLSCGNRECFARPKARADAECPWVSKLGTLSDDDQRAARRDPRCEALGTDHSYFSGNFSFTPGPTIVIEPEAAGAASNLSAEDASAAAAALRAGQVVVDNARYVENGKVTLDVRLLGKDNQEVATVSAPAFVLPHQPKAPITMMTKQTASTLGLTARPLLTFATTTRVPSVAEEDRLRAALGGEYEVSVARGPAENNQVLVILAVVAGVIALGAAGMATGLAAADSRADLGTLAAVGASPRLRRALSLSQTGVIAGLGSVLGVVAGLGAPFAVLSTLNQRFADAWPAPQPFALDIPWLNVAVALILVPGLAMLGAGLLTRSRLPIERRL